MPHASCQPLPFSPPPRRPLACPQYEHGRAPVQYGRRGECRMSMTRSSSAQPATMRSANGRRLSRPRTFLAAPRLSEDPTERRDLLGRALAFEKHWRSYA